MCVVSRSSFGLLFSPLDSKKTQILSFPMNERRTLGLLPLALVLCVSACSKEPSRWDQAATAQLPAPSAPKVEGSKLNAFFPPDGTDGFSRVFTQEKDGFVEAKFKKDGKDVATLAISDASNDESVKSKYATAADRLEEQPLVTVGKNQSALLVNNKFQVKVSSPTLDADARKALLSKFDLKGLTKL